MENGFMSIADVYKELIKDTPSIKYLLPTVKKFTKWETEHGRLGGSHMQYYAYGLSGEVVVSVDVLPRLIAIVKQECGVFSGM